MTAVVETRGLGKRYGRSVAVDRLDLTVEEGEVFGLLGPNGSGKTTTILMLLGLTTPTSGTVRVVGRDPIRDPLGVKRRVGYLPDRVGFYDDLTAAENLRFTARLAGLASSDADARIDAALERMGLATVARQRVATFSRGMRQRLGLAEVLVKRPRLAILDEPTTGLDPDAARDLLRLIRELKDESLTVLLSSHLLQQVQSVCDRVGLFDAGRMALTGTVSDLAERVLGGGQRLRVEASGADVQATLEAVPGVVRVRRAPDGAWQVEADRDVRPAVAGRLARAGAELLSLSLITADLDEVYARYFEGVRRAAA